MMVNATGALSSGIVALVLLLLGPLGGSLTGEWVGRDEEGTEERISLRADGKGAIDDVRLEWRASGDTLLVRFEGIPIEAKYGFRVEGDHLWLRDDEGESRQYRRVGGGAGGSSGSTDPIATTSTAVSSDGVRFASARGFEVDLPGGWRAQAAEWGGMIFPPDFQATMEVFSVESRPLGTATTITHPDVLAFFDGQALSVAPFLVRRAAPEALEGGGARLLYDGVNPAGIAVRGLVLARVLGKDGVYVAAIAARPRVDALEPALRKVYGSIRAVKAGASGGVGD